MTEEIVGINRDVTKVLAELRTYTQINRVTYTFILQQIHVIRFIQRHVVTNTYSYLKQHARTFFFLHIISALVG